MIIVLTKGKVCHVDDDDYEWLSNFKWCTEESGYKFYAKRTNKCIKMHREIMWRYYPNSDKSLLVDHIDGDGLNNRKLNLRFATYSQNNANSKKIIVKTSKYKGVFFDKSCGKYRASIDFQGKNFRSPRFVNELDAVEWYNSKAKEYFGEFALVNK
jgi:hypothetical protein